MRERVIFLEAERGRRRAASWSWAWLALPLLLLAGCSHFEPKPKVEYVYVTQKQTYLRDHVAAVSNHTGVVENGQRLEVLEHGHRFLRVKDAKGQTGWIEERYTAPQSVYDGFAALKQRPGAQSVVGTAVVRDEVYMHLKPGRDTDHLFLLPEGAKLQLLERASTEKPLPPQAAPLAGSGEAGKAGAKAAPVKPQAKGAGGKKKTGPAAIVGAPTVPMEDWWLARDANGDVGWVLGRRFDLDVPDAIAGYAENQRFVGAYVLGTVNDPASDFPDKKAPVYLTLLAPYKDGLPYDYSQVRVFGWSTKHHRYETSYREHDLWGYLPVVIGKQSFPEGVEPVFTLRVSPTPDATIDPATGIATPAQTVEKTYRLDGEVVKKVLPGGTPAKAGAQAKTTRPKSEPEPRHPAERHKRKVS
jgi:SH3-like domain-containing protein